jgi:hypothetical protein
MMKKESKQRLQGNKSNQIEHLIYKLVDRKRIYFKCMWNTDWETRSKKYIRKCNNPVSRIAINPKLKISSYRLAE